MLKVIQFENSKSSTLGIFRITRKLKNDIREKQSDGSEKVTGCFYEIQLSNGTGSLVCTCGEKNDILKFRLFDDVVYVEFDDSEKGKKKITYAALVNAPASASAGTNLSK